MKKVETVLTHLLSRPTYAKLGEQECFRLIRKALPDPLRRGILFMYVKNRTLFFAMKHPAFKMEFDYKHSLIKNLLTSLPPLREACEGYRIETIKAFVSRFAPTAETRDDTEPKYRERAHPTFPLKSEKREIVEAFEGIRKSIEKNLRR
ncbi:hypothetical protein [Hydrogenimonas sp.]